MKSLKILVSAGPTREKIDPVRFLSNRSSGKMGYALAAAACKLGAQVTLVSGPVALERPAGVEFIEVESAEEMAQVIITRAGNFDLIIMAAAVADFRPVHFCPQKIKKTPDKLVLELERTRDILAGLGELKKTGQTLVGFAAESENLEANALDKLKRKNLDWIIANDIASPGSGFAVDFNAVTIYGRNLEKFVIERAPKRIVAEKILEIVCNLKKA